MNSGYQNYPNNNLQSAASQLGAITPRPTTELEGLATTQETLFGGFSDSCARLESILDRIHGPRPQEVANSAGPPVASNPIARIRSAQEHMATLGNRLHELLNRLETIG